MIPWNCFTGVLDRSVTVKKKNKLLIGFAIMDIIIMVMVLVVKNNHVVVEREEKQSNAAAANILANGNDSLDEYKNNEIANMPKIVYDNMTMDQLSAKLDKTLTTAMSGKGRLIAGYSLQNGVDPYMATAIILQETGCAFNCSSMVSTCNNVGGQKGSGCGAYAAFPTLDDGIKGFIDNLRNNFVSKGLTTPEAIGPRYAESGAWTERVNYYINYIKAR